MVSSSLFYFSLIILLGIVFLSGIIVTIVSAHKAAVSKRSGVRVCLGGVVTGIIMMILPVVLFSLFIIFVIIPAANTIAPAAKKGIYKFFGQEITEYIQNKDNDVFFKDKWKKGGLISDSSAAYDAVETMLAAADSGDAETLYECFPEAVQDHLLKKQIEDFLAEYPEGLGKNGVFEDKDPPCSGGGEYNDGKADLHLNTSYNVTLGETVYHIFLNATYTCDDDPSQVGVTWFLILTDEAKNRYEHANLNDFTYIYADTILQEGELDYPVLNNTTVQVEAIDRIVRESDVVAALAEERSYSRFKERFGDPNGSLKVPHEENEDFFYILTDDSGGKKYLILRVNDGEEINPKLCCICKSSGDVEAWFDENGSLGN